MMLSSCPVCGNKTQMLCMPYKAKVGDGVGISEVITCSCPECGFCTSDFNENEKSKEEALKLARLDCISKDISSLEGKYSFSEIERAFGLPQRTLSKYKNKTKNPSASAVALMRLLHVFPWLVLVASTGYSQPLAYKIVTKALEKKAKGNGVSIDMMYAENDSKVGFAIISDKNTIKRESIDFSNLYLGNSYENQ